MPMLSLQTRISIVMHERGGSNRAPPPPSNHQRSRVTRCLFGEPDHHQIQKDLTSMHKNLDTDAKAKWNFDFGEGTPLPGPYAWEPAQHGDEAATVVDAQVEEARLEVERDVIEDSQEAQDAMVLVEEGMYNAEPLTPSPTSSSSSSSSISSSSSSLSSAFASSSASSGSIPTAQSSVGEVQTQDQEKRSRDQRHNLTVVLPPLQPHSEPSSRASAFREHPKSASSSTSSSAAAPTRPAKRKIPDYMPCKKVPRLLDGRSDGPPKV